MNDEEMMNAWRNENNRGNGYPVGDESMNPREAAKAEKYTDIREITSTGNVVCHDRKVTIVICQANGPWACKIEEV
jgi:hypothetical protein